MKQVPERPRPRYLSRSCFSRCKPLLLPCCLLLFASGATFTYLTSISLTASISLAAAAPSVPFQTRWAGGDGGEGVASSAQQVRELCGMGRGGERG